jgi:hypothetical protein
MTIGTEPLTPDLTWREIQAIREFLTSLGIENVNIAFGWGCKADGIEQPVMVRVAELVNYLHNIIAQEIYHLGEDNLYIGAHEPVLTFTLCHDSDIHFEATDRVLEARGRGEWEGRGVSVWPKVRAA